MGPYIDIRMRKLSGDQFIVLVQEDWRGDDPFSMRNGWRVDTVWRSRAEAQRRVKFLEKELER